MELPTAKIIKVCDIIITIGGENVLRVQSDYDNRETSAKLRAAATLIDAIDRETTLIPRLESHS
jgi:hypothetical protein